MHTDPRLFASATQRNRDAILPILRRVLPASGTILEVGSGSGEHAVYFAANLPQTQWIPSDTDSAALASISAWIQHAGASNVAPPIALNVGDTDWPIASVDAMVCINVIHYSPWESTPALFAGAARLLSPGGVLYLYGPYRRNGQHTAASNAAFDAWLKSVDPSFGVRDLEDVEQQAGLHGFSLDEVLAMPANNFSLVLRRL